MKVSQEAGRRALRAIVLFFLAMLLLTLLSRALSAAVMPAVETCAPTQGALVQTLEADAVVQNTGGEVLLLPEGILVEQVHTAQGETVVQGAVLAQLSQSALQAAHEKARAETAQLAVQIRQLNTPLQADAYPVQAAQAALDDAYRMGEEAKDDAERNAAHSAAKAANATRDAALHAYELEAQALQKQMEQNSAEAAKLSVQREQTQARMDALQALLDADGAVLAPFSGMMTQWNLSQGAATPAGGTAGILAQADAGYAVTCTLPAQTETALLAVGQRATLKQGSTSVPACVGAILPSPQDGTTEVTLLPGDGAGAVFPAQLGAGALRAGGARVQIELSKTRHDLCVPLSAVNQDNRGAFVYVLETRSTVLGEQNVLVRVPVSIQEQADGTAAVQGGLSPQSKVVRYASRPLEEGARVKLL